MTNIDLTRKNLKQAMEERDRLNDQIADLQAQLDSYDNAKTKRPKDVPTDWDPIIDAKGAVKGWVAPDWSPFK